MTSCSQKPSKDPPPWCRWPLCQTGAECVSAVWDVRKQLVCGCSAALSWWVFLFWLCGKGWGFEDGRAFDKVNLLYQSGWKMCHDWSFPSVSFILCGTGYQNQDPMHVRPTLYHSQLWQFLFLILLHCSTKILFLFFKARSHCWPRPSWIQCGWKHPQSWLSSPMLGL